MLLEFSELLYYIKPIVMLFIVLDPIAVTPYYQAIASRYDATRRPALLRTTVVAMTSFLLAFALLGDLLFGLFNISFEDFKIAAGVVLLVYAVASLLGVELGGSRSGGEEAAIVPLATPLLAGPAATSVTLFIKYTYGLPVAILAVVVNAVIVYVVFSLGEKITKLIGSQGMVLIEKFLSFLLAALATSIMFSGLQGKGLLPRAPAIPQD
ncbi:MAG: MarC family protein [Acidilobaceae archaeon]